MTTSSTSSARVEIVLGALLYLMTEYRRRPCRRIAGCVAHHLELLARHAHADPAIRELCAQMYEEWQSAADQALPARNAHPLH